MIRILTEFLKIPETIRIPIVGGYWYKILNYIDNLSIKNEIIKKPVLNNTPRDIKVIASLTSYPKRINIVHIAIKSLMIQSFKPDRIILWLSDEQFPNRELPNQLLKLLDYGLEICWMKDLYGHKKYFYPILNQKENEVVITFDDDLIYSYKLIERLMSKHYEFPNALICERGQSIDIDNLFNPGKWKVISNIGVKEPSYCINPSPGGGCLIPFKSLYFDITNEDFIKRYAFKNDDLWIMFMAVEQKTKTLKSRKYHKPFSTNNDSQFEQMAYENIILDKNMEIMKELIKIYPDSWNRIVGNEL